MENEKLLTVKQFADAVGISQQAVYQAMQGKLKPYKVKDSKHIYIMKQAITDLYSDIINTELKELEQGKQAEIENLNKELEKLEQDLNKALEKVELMNNTLSEKDKEISSLEQIKEALTSDLNNLNNKLNDTEKQLADASARLEEKDKLIEILQTDKASLNEIINKLQEDNADVVTSLKQLTMNNSKLEYQIQEYGQQKPDQHLQEQLTEQAEEIEKLKAELAEQQSRPGFFKRLFGKG